MSIACLIPAYNAGKWIERTISCVRGERSVSEIIVCDDGSTDNTVALVQSQAAQDHRISLLCQQNSGASNARNSAFANSRAELILFLDADDLLLPFALDHADKLARANPSAVINFPWAKINASDDVVYKGPSPPRSGVTGSKWISQAFNCDYPTYPGSILIPRRLIDQAGLWDERLSFQDDMDFYSRVISQSPLVLTCPQAMFLYRADVPQSLSKTSGNKSSQSWYLATQLASQNLLSVDSSAEAASGAARQLMLAAYGLFTVNCQLSQDLEAEAIKVAPLGWTKPNLPGGNIRIVLQSILGWKNALKFHNNLNRLRRMGTKLLGAKR
jgi:glycosyltransferase involved in cell wall biosynthesis